LSSSAFIRTAGLLILLTAVVRPLLAQEGTISTGIDTGASKPRVAVPNFYANTNPSAPADTSLVRVFDTVLWSDLENSGIMDLVSKSFYPKAIPSRPTGLNLAEWSAAPSNAHMLVLGNATRAGEQLVIEGWLLDARNAQSPVVLTRRYSEQNNERAVRSVAHKFANEIITRLSGGIAGITESRIAFVRRASPTVKEIWMMDYDGSNQEQITRLNTISLTPAISVDGTQIAFTTYLKKNPDIMVMSLLTKQPLAFFNRKGLNTTPTWSPDGSRLAFTSSVTGDPEIYLGDVRGNNTKRLTFARSVDIQPAWNPKTGAQIAFVSDRSGHPMIYMMDSEGADVTQLVTGGTQALDPAWSPNGRLLAFTWNQDGAYDIYLMDVATKQIVQLTRGGGRNEHPSWSPDNRQIVFQSTRAGKPQIFSMLADGTKVRQLTFQGENTEPVWSSR
jgi:TolB protein